MKALVVDDSRAIRSLVSRLLKSRGFEIAEAGNGVEALAVLGAQGPFDIALFDWNMPVMDGYQLLQAVRADQKHAAMRVMMVTTETELPRLTNALQAGANEYLMKPFTAEALAEKLTLLGVEGHA